MIYIIMYFILPLSVNFVKYVYYFRIVFLFQIFLKEYQMKIILHLKCTQM